MEKDLELQELGQFHGTEHYYKDMFDVLLTDGVKYIMENGYSWFVTDQIVNLMRFKDGFYSVKLKLLSNSKAEAIITDGNNNILNVQKYEYTDAKRELNLFFYDNVLMLSGEY